MAKTSATAKSTKTSLTVSITSDAPVQNNAQTANSKAAIKPISSLNEQQAKTANQKTLNTKALAPETKESIKDNNNQLTILSSIDASLKSLDKNIIAFTTDQNKKNIKNDQNDNKINQSDKPLLVELPKEFPSQIMQAYSDIILNDKSLKDEWKVWISEAIDLSELQKLTASKLDGLESANAEKSDYDVAKNDQAINYTEYFEAMKQNQNEIAERMKELKSVYQDNNLSEEFQNLKSSFEEMSQKIGEETLKFANPDVSDKEIKEFHEYFKEAFEKNLEKLNAIENKTEETPKPESKTEETPKPESKTEEAQKPESKTEETPKPESKTEEATKPESKTEETPKTEEATGPETVKTLKEALDQLAEASKNEVDTKEKKDEVKAVDNEIRTSVEEAVPQKEAEDLRNHDDAIDQIMFDVLAVREDIDDLEIEKINELTEKLLKSKEPKQEKPLKKDRKKDEEKPGLKKQEKKSASRKKETLKEKIIKVKDRIVKLNPLIPFSKKTEATKKNKLGLMAKGKQLFSTISNGIPKLFGKSKKSEKEKSHGIFNLFGRQNTISNVDKNDSARNFSANAKRTFIGQSRNRRRIIMGRKNDSKADTNKILLQILNVVSSFTKVYKKSTDESRKAALFNLRFGKSKKSSKKPGLMDTAKKAVAAAGPYGAAAVAAFDIIKFLLPIFAAIGLAFYVLGPKLLDWLWKGLQKLFNAIPKIFNFLWNLILNAFKWLAKNIVPIIKTILKVIVKILWGFIKFILKLIPLVIEIIAKIFIAIGSAIWDGIKWIVNKVKEIGLSIWNGFKNFLASILEKIPFMGDLAKKLRGDSGSSSSESKESSSKTETDKSKSEPKRNTAARLQSTRRPSLSRPPVSRPPVSRPSSYRPTAYRHPSSRPSSSSYARGSYSRGGGYSYDKSKNIDKLGKQVSVATSGAGENKEQKPVSKKQSLLTKIAAGVITIGKYVAGIAKKLGVKIGSQQYQQNGKKQPQKPKSFLGKVGSALWSVAKWTPHGMAIRAAMWAGKKALGFGERLGKRFGIIKTSTVDFTPLLNYVKTISNAVIAIANLMGAEIKLETENNEKVTDALEESTENKKAETSKKENPETGYREETDPQKIKAVLNAHGIKAGPNGQVDMSNAHGMAPGTKWMKNKRYKQAKQRIEERKARMLAEREGEKGKKDGTAIKNDQPGIKQNDKLKAGEPVSLLDYIKLISKCVTEIAKIMGAKLEDKKSVPKPKTEDKKEPTNIENKKAITNVENKNATTNVEKKNFESENEKEPETLQQQQPPPPPKPKGMFGKFVNFAKMTPLGKLVSGGINIGKSLLGGGIVGTIKKIINRIKRMTGLTGIIARSVIGIAKKLGMKYNKQQIKPSSNIKTVDKLEDQEKSPLNKDASGYREETDPQKIKAVLNAHGIKAGPNGQVDMSEAGKEQPSSSLPRETAHNKFEETENVKQSEMKAEKESNIGKTVPQKAKEAKKMESSNIKSKSTGAAESAKHIDNVTKNAQSADKSNQNSLEAEKNSEKQARNLDKSFSKLPLLIAKGMIIYESTSKSNNKWGGIKAKSEREELIEEKMGALDSIQGS